MPITTEGVCQRRVASQAGAGTATPVADCTVPDTGARWTSSYSAPKQKPAVAATEVANTPAMPTEASFGAGVVTAIKAYLAQPKRIAFPSSASVDSVNEAFWSTRSTGSGWMWQVVQGGSPADAVGDAVLHNPGKYQTECALALQLFNLAGLLQADVERFGAQAGKLLFDARFTREPQSDSAAVQKWVTAFQRSGETFDAFARTTPPPKFTSELHLDASGPHNRITILHQFDVVTGKDGKPGDAGYMPNHAVKVSTMTAGGAGQNFLVVDTAPNGERILFGHGVGKLPESKLRDRIAQGSIEHMSDFLEYFDLEYTNKPTNLAPDTKELVDRWLRAGPLSSRKAFAEWVETDDFAQWHLEKLGTPYDGPRTLEGIPLATLKAVVAAAIPATKRMPTAFAALNGHDEERTVNFVCEQMAELLKNGALTQGEPMFARRTPLDPSAPIKSRYVYD